MHGSMQTDPDISGAAAILADKSRAVMLIALAEGGAMPAGELAHHARVSAQTASSHLARMLEAGLVKVEVQGRHRYYSVANEHVARLLEALSIVAQPRPVLTSIQNDAAKTLRFARTCYGHMAGVVGVSITEAMTKKRILRDSDAGWLVTPAGERWFEELGIDVEKLRRERRPLTRTCLDWSERRHHLAGALGDATANRYFELGWVARVRQSRAVRLTDRGRAALKDRLGIEL
jgi:DNA-binding transcriptional ArsR family regulator